MVLYTPLMESGTVLAMFNWGQNAPTSEKKSYLNTRDAEVSSYLAMISNSAGLGKDALSAEDGDEC